MKATWYFTEIQIFLKLQIFAKVLFTPKITDKILEVANEKAKRF